MRLDKLSGRRTITSEFRRLINAIAKDPSTKKIKPEERKVRPKRLTRDQLTKIISVSNNGGGRMVLSLETLDTIQIIRVITDSPEKLLEIVSNRNVRLR